MIEVKDAKAGNNSPTKKREHFDIGQIKTHFAKAIVKILDERYINPNSKFAIAHPDGISIRKSIAYLILELKLLGITYFWVAENRPVLND